MGMTVETSIPPAAVELAANIRRAMLAAAEPIFEAAREGAPYEEVPKHGYHLRDSAVMQMQPGADADQVMIGFGAFWAGWQHEHMDWHHTEGHAKYLELAMTAGGKAWLEAVAAQVFHA